MDLADRVVENAKADPNAVIELSQDDLEVIIKGVRALIKTVEAPDKGEVLSDEYKQHFKNADTFIYRMGLASRDFEVEGQPFKGGQVNYIAVGMMAAHYGHGEWVLKPMVNGWNMNQIREGEGFDHNWTEVSVFFTSPALRWATYGHRRY